MLAAPLLLVACSPTPTRLPVDTATPGVTDTSVPADDTGPTDTDPTDTDTDTSDTATETGTDPDPPPTTANRRPLVCAIRWDAWQEDATIQDAVETTLGPEHWHDRMPWFGTVVDPDTVRIAGNDPALMDAEIAAAADAGIDFWAFVAYPPDEGMSNGLELYLSRPDSTRIGYALNLQGGWLAHDPEEWDAQVDRYVAHFLDPRYVKVEGDRPLVFLFDTPSLTATSRFPTLRAAGTAFALLAETTVAVGLGRPYLVTQGWDPAADKATLDLLGGDALGAYATYGGSESGGSFADLSAYGASIWDVAAGTGAGVLPLVTTGWDPRPRYENPVFGDIYGSEVYTDTATAEEIAGHLAAGLEWVDRHPVEVPAAAVLIYAWNEHDEGGWLCPTWTEAGPDTRRLDAVATTLAAHDTPLILNGSFESPVAPSGWYVVGADGLPTTFGWTGDVPAGTYLLATPLAAHFPAAADGDQVLLLQQALTASLGTAAAGETWTVALSLLTGTFPGDPPGTLTATLSRDGTPLATADWATPVEPGVWETQRLSTTVDAAGALTLTLTPNSGYPWVDAVGVEVE